MDCHVLPSCLALTTATSSIRLASVTYWTAWAMESCSAFIVSPFSPQVDRLALPEDGPWSGTPTTLFVIAATRHEHQATTGAGTQHTLDCTAFAASLALSGQVVEVLIEPLPVLGCLPAFALPQGVGQSALITPARL
jgi:hypothetical protein